MFMNIIFRRICCIFYNFPAFSLSHALFISSFLLTLSHFPTFPFCFIPPFLSHSAPFPLRSFPLYHFFPTLTPPTTSTILPSSHFHSSLPSLHNAFTIPPTLHPHHNIPSLSFPLPPNPPRYCKVRLCKSCPSLSLTHTSIAPTLEISFLI